MDGVQALTGASRCAETDRSRSPLDAGGRLVPDGSAVLGDPKAEIHGGDGKRREPLVQSSDAQEGILLE